MRARRFGVVRVIRGSVSHVRVYRDVHEQRTDIVEKKVAVGSGEGEGRRGIGGEEEKMKETQR